MSVPSRYLQISKINFAKDLLELEEASMITLEEQ